MKEEIFENLEGQLSRRDLEEIKKKSVHLGIFTEPYLTLMLEGKKTIESRFSKNRIAPYEKVDKGDVVIVKKSGGKVVAYFIVEDVMFFDLNKTPIGDIKEKYGSKLLVTDEFWALKQNSNYATLINIGELVNLKPFSVKKKGMQTWIKLS